jgi:hypothetical protein
MTRTWIPFVLVVLALLVGCDPGAPGSGDDPEQMVTIPAEQARTLELDEWGLEGDDELGELADLALLPGGGVALLDRLAAVVLVFGPQGREVTRIGGLGEGPGEFTPQGLSTVVATDATLVVPDIQLQRVTRFTLEGQLLDSEDLAAAAGPEGGVFGVGWQAHPQGGLVLLELSPRGQQVLRFLDGELESLHTFDLPPPEPNQILPPSPVWAMDPEGRLLVGRTDRAEVSLIAREGDDPIWTARWPDREGTELSSQEEEHLEELVAESAQARGMPPVSVTLPREAPILAGALAHPEGGVWVQRARPVSEMGLSALQVGGTEGFGGQIWDVLDSQGRGVEAVRLPLGFLPRSFGPAEAGGQSCLYGILEDDVGIRTARRVCPQEGR